MFGVISSAKIILEAAAERHIDRMHFRAARKELTRTNKTGMRVIKHSNRVAERDQRRQAAMADLPAGRVARFNHRADQAATLVNTVATIASALIAIKAAYRELRVAPSPTPEPTSSDEPPKRPRSGASAPSLRFGVV